MNTVDPAVPYGEPKPTGIISDAEVEAMERNAAFLFSGHKISPQEAYRAGQLDMLKAIEAKMNP